MYPYILCFCGRALGDIYDLFKAMVRLEYEAAYADAKLDDIDPFMLSISELVNVKLEGVFDKLHIHTDCCRVRLLTQTEFRDYY